MNTAKLQKIHIAPAERARPRGALWAILLFVLLVTGGAAFLAWPRAGDDRRVVNVMAGKAKPAASTPAASTPAASAPPISAASGAKTELARTAPVAPGEGNTGAVVLTASGYIINRERIELSPRLQGLVKWIGVKKGDRVSAGQLVVVLDDAEQRAHLLEAEGRLGSARARLEKAQLAFARARRLTESRVESQQLEDDARVEVAAARAAIQEAEGTRALAQTQLDWTQIHSPIDGVVLEKLTESGELVTPQSFGGTRGPSTGLIAVADPGDLQVEIDVNEADLSKITLGQRCRVAPEAYPDKVYGGFVAEIAPEANRQKGTLQVKVQIEKPDHFLTPELSARVDFLQE